MIAPQGGHSAPRSRDPSQGVPRILCWHCRKLTPFELDRCANCGTAFAGSTGGAYAKGSVPSRSISIPAPRPEPEKPERTLAEIFADMQKVYDVAERGTASRRGKQELPPLFQCPACERFVSESAPSCLCGVRFASSSSSTFACPECGSHVPVMEDACPVCGIGFDPDPQEELIFACPRCGAHVASDAVRCSCGVWFED